MTITDVLETRMNVVGLGGYASGLRQGAQLLGSFAGTIGDATKLELALGVAAGATSLAIVAGLQKATIAAGQHEAVITRVSASFQQFGHSVPQAELVAWTNQVQDATGIARDQVASIAGLYAEYGLTAEQTKKFTKATLESSVALKAQGTSAEQIARFVGTAIQMAQQGDVKGLTLLSRRIGIVVNEARVASDPMGAILDALNRKGGEQAELYKNTLPGAIDAFKASVVRLAQDVGVYFVGPLTDAVNLGTRFVDFLDQNPKLVAFAAGLTAVALGIKAVNTALTIFSASRAVIGGLSGLLGGAIGGGAAGGISAAGQAARAAEFKLAMESAGKGASALTWREISGASAIAAAPSIVMRLGKVFRGGLPTTELIPGKGGVNVAAASALMGPQAAEAGGAAAVSAGTTAAGAAGLGLGARALGLLKGPIGIGLLLAGAGYGAHALAKGHENTFMGKLGAVGGSALEGAGAGLTTGALIGSLFGPGPGTFIGGLIGGVSGGIGGALFGGSELQKERESQKSNKESLEELTKSNRELRQEINFLNKNLGELVGDRDLRATIGDARIIGAFARGIA